MKTLFITLIILISFSAISEASTKGTITEWHEDTNTYSSVEIQISNLTGCYALYKHYIYRNEIKNYEAFEMLERELGDIIIYISANGQFKRIVSSRMLKIAFDHEMTEGDVGLIIHNKYSDLTNEIDYFKDESTKESLYPYVKEALSNIKKHSGYIIRLFKRKDIIKIDI